ncbi:MULTISPECIES: F0F1 ATP synthase subunit delta [Comamonas]|jgi:F-type H+-transporting ATPase subunit delta|uniref:ATP synthase subunit delta n=1 Tax=Comamonas terrigena TaxID=32013 RepID=A0A2A7URS9_COMTR|nr:MULTISPECIES: F0F1 ATP synthase subunit delta [Comamonas]MBD9533952.1 F0F1 ATP synthase subunit delta [Comamonas sp. CMM01]MBV7419415.1 F0F1 ATP synthase subunit delta [Comamonas sp. CMM03]MDH0049104.1 F0F1 ATP synthase subunit delta [Comamonas terrigena]MDH0512107.1 F0F1 ATP synthase subunit delta [Comamonas terrigena]MDH1091515.1 F0F1 ATP synthase subunit delta [Comamonas terrigena]
MAELATIARPYAEALFKASADKGADLGSTVAWVEELAAIAADPQLRQLADNPNVSKTQVFDLIAGVAKSALPEAARNFLRVVLENGRLDALPEAAAQFRSLVNSKSGSSDAVVFSAFPIADAALAELGASLEKRFGRKLNLTVKPDDSLIGGVRVVVGDEVLDTSVKARLEQMKAALIA